MTERELVRQALMIEIGEAILDHFREVAGGTADFNDAELMDVKTTAVAQRFFRLCYTRHYDSLKGDPETLAQIDKRWFIAFMRMGETIAAAVRVTDPAWLRTYIDSLPPDRGRWLGNLRKTL